MQIAIKITTRLLLAIEVGFSERDHKFTFGAKQKQTSNDS